jgi:hypothetical protein
MEKKWAKVGAGMAILWVLSWLSGCAILSPGPKRANFQPLFLYSVDEEKGKTTTEILGPLFYFSKDRESEHLAFRPFFYWQNEKGEYSRLEYLFPLGKYKRTDREVDSYFVPLFSTHRDLTQEVEEKKRTFLLAIWGKTEGGEDYGGLFPFYGHLKNRFGRDEVNFFLWPVYADTHEGENRTSTFLWPFFTFSQGGDREAAKFWPFYGYDRKENDFEKTYFLWPIFQSEKRYLYTDDPTEIEMVFPLYVSFSSASQSSTWVLWPLFNHNRNEKTHYSQWDMPWPLLRWAEGEDTATFRLFPLYGRKQRPNRETGFFLFPVHWYDFETEKDYEKRTVHFLLLSKDETEIWKDEGREAKSLRLWPFCSYRLRKDSSARFYAPVIIPFDEEGVDRNWAPLFSLYSRTRDPEGEYESRFLWGVYLHQWNSTHDRFELSFLMTYYRAEDLSYFSLLQGLFEYRAEGPRRALRLLYWPWPIEWGDDAARLAGLGEREDRVVRRVQ